ncbi:MAG TPA: hypothetical protein VF623_05555 [Segetibacter sp.]
MKIFIVIGLIFLSAINSYGQQDSVLKVLPEDTIAGGIQDFTIDNLGNIYLLTATNQVKKLNAKGDSIAVYNDVRRYGKISSIDATNPLKILVYYNDFLTVIVLDRLLNVRNTIDLRRQNIFQVRAITTSYDNNIWLYDELDSKLKKIDDNGRLLLESTDFRQVFDSVPTPNVLYDRDGQLYLYDPAKGLFVFDYYGGKKNNFQILHLTDLQVIDKNTITARNNLQVLLYKPSTLQLFSFRVFDEKQSFKKINFTGSKIYSLDNNGTLKIFSVIK